LLLHHADTVIEGAPDEEGPLDIVQ